MEMILDDGGQCPHKGPLQREAGGQSQRGRGDRAAVTGERMPAPKVEGGAPAWEPGSLYNRERPAGGFRRQVPRRRNQAC